MAPEGTVSQHAWTTVPAASGVGVGTILRMASKIRAASKDRRDVIGKEGRQFCLRMKGDENFARYDEKSSTDGGRFGLKEFDIFRL